MAQISKERILEFQKIFKDKYDKKLSFAEATNNLVGFFDLLLKIDRRNKNKTNKNNERHNQKLS